MKTSQRIIDLIGLTAIGALLAFVFCGCAHFQTTQYDYRYDPDTGKQTGKIKTHASATTLFESKSQLTNFKASQSEKTQGASVGSLTQESGGTNTAATVNAVVELLKVLKQ